MLNAVKIAALADLKPRFRLPGTAVVMIKIKGIHIAAVGAVPNLLQRMNKKRCIYTVIAVNIYYVGAVRLPDCTVACI